MKAYASFFYVLAAALTGWGFMVLGHYGDCSETGFKLDTCSSWEKMGHVLGGDAYNYIVMAGRGTAWMVAGLTCAVIATGLIIVQALQENGRTLDRSEN